MPRDEGVDILCALYSRRDDPPSESEAERLAEYFSTEVGPLGKEEREMAWIAVEKGSGKVIVQGAESKMEARAAAEALPHFLSL